VRVHGPVTEATVESWQFVIDVNLLAVAYACKFAIPMMAANGGGTIVTISSANATVGRSGMGQYDATKAAVLALTRLDGLRPRRPGDPGERGVAGSDADQLSRAESGGADRGDA
jgi:NAD(P)-dependent dehydrogenase (short-subunit alcohol dehydrogenase family)